MSKLNEMILYSGVGIKEIGKYLDNLDSNSRVEMVRTMKAPSLRALWELAEGTKVVLEST